MYQHWKILDHDTFFFLLFFLSRRPWRRRPRFCSSFPLLSQARERGRFRDASRKRPKPIAFPLRFILFPFLSSLSFCLSHSFHPHIWFRKPIFTTLFIHLIDYKTVSYVNCYFSLIFQLVFPRSHLLGKLPLPL